MEKKMADDEMYCPECGGVIKKGFYTCANCKLKVRLTKEANKNQDSAK
jgi:DNA-directed RNA polymerase subunit RPC12/RpoP